MEIRCTSRSTLAAAKRRPNGTGETGPPARRTTKPASCWSRLPSIWGDANRQPRSAAEVAILPGLRDAVGWRFGGRAAHRGDFGFAAARLAQDFFPIVAEQRWGQIGLDRPGLDVDRLTQRARHRRVVAKI